MIREGALPIFRGRILQADGTDSANAVRWEHVCVFKENPEAQGGWNRGREGQGGRRDEIKEAMIADHAGPCRSSDFYAERNESLFFF